MVLVVCLLLLVQAGAAGIRPAVQPAAGAKPCSKVFRIGFVTDVAGLRSVVDTDGWRGVRDAARSLTCVKPELAVPSRPSDYRRVLQAAADDHDDLIIAGSFLLTDVVVDTARGNPGTHFVLVDPIIIPPAVPNLAVLSFREDQAAFLAGALAAMVTRTGVVAGVYGPDGWSDRENRLGFEHGALYARPGVQVLGAYQPASGGMPYANPEWGAAQAKAFLNQGADIVFGAGGGTGQGALLAAAQAGRLCIGADSTASSYPPAAGCLLTSAVKFIERIVRFTVADTVAGRWHGGLRRLGLGEGAVGVSPLTNPLLKPEILERLQVISGLLADSSLTTGA